MILCKVSLSWPLSCNIHCNINCYYYLKSKIECHASISLSLEVQLNNSTLSHCHIGLHFNIAGSRMQISNLICSQKTWSSWFIWNVLSLIYSKYILFNIFKISTLQFIYPELLAFYSAWLCLLASYLHIHFRMLF